jgi:hypothetical protein
MVSDCAAFRRTSAICEWFAGESELTFRDRTAASQFPA